MALGTPRTKTEAEECLAPETIAEHRHAATETARNRIAAELSDARIPFSIETVDTAPTAALAGLAGRRDGDLVVVSSQGRRGLARGLIGSVSGELIRHGDTDRLIVPRTG